MNATNPLPLQGAVQGGTSAAPTLECKLHPDGPYVRVDGARCRGCGTVASTAAADVESNHILFPVRACAQCIRTSESACSRCGSHEVEFFLAVSE